MDKKDTCELVIYRLSEFGRIDNMGVGFDGVVYIRTSYEDYCRNCHMGTIEEDWIISLESLMDPGFNIDNWRAEEEVKRKEAVDLILKKKKQQEIERQHVKDLETYQELKKKFN